MASLVNEVTDALSGGLQGDALSRLNFAARNLSNLSAPDLQALIPQLQMQVQQGTMDPATYEAVLAQVLGQAQAQQYQAVQTRVSGTASPAVYEAVQAAMQGRLSAPQFQAVQAQLQSTLNPSSYQAVMASVSGMASPQQVQAALQQDSAMAGLMSDAATLDAARGDLAQLGEIADKGLTEADRAALNAAMNETQSRVASSREAQLQQLQMQGLGGSGASLAARLAGGQQEANAFAAAGANTAMEQQRRALAALQASLQGNTQLNQQLFGQGAQKAQAIDAVNQFNANARNQISLANQRAAQEAMLAQFNAANQVNMANALAANQAGQFNAGQQMAANTANFNTAAQFALQNANAQNMAAAQNAQMQFGANQGNFNTANQIALANQNAQNQALTTAANNTQQANLANFNAQNTANNLNAQAQNQALAQNAQLGTQANFNNFNTANQVNLANTAAQNAARGQNAANTQQANLTNFNRANDIMAANTQTANTQAMLPYNTAQGTFKNQLDLGKSQADANAYVAQIGLNQANRQATNTGNMIQGAYNMIPDGTIPGLIDKGVNWLGSFFSDEDMKTDKKTLDDQDIDRLMAEMTGYAYRYKGDKTKRAGVMAQDLERGGSNAVQDTPMGKQVKGPEILGEALAVLANHHERLKKMEGSK